jgi:hypothetical protein
MAHLPARDDRHGAHRRLGHAAGRGVPPCRWACCAANIAPRWVYQPVRRLMDACRAINEMVFAMLFIVAVGLGPFAGVLALAVHTTGTLAKLFSEAVEAIDPRPVEGIRATGAHTPWWRSSTASSRRCCRCG